MTSRPAWRDSRVYSLQLANHSAELISRSRNAARHRAFDGGIHRGRWCATANAGSGATFLLTLFSEAERRRAYRQL